MSSRKSLRRSLALAGLLLAGLLAALAAMPALARHSGSLRSAFAADGSRPLAPGELRIAPSFDLDDITADELTHRSGSSHIDQGRWQRSRAFAGLPPLLTEIRRIMPALWRMGIDDGNRSGSVDVRYELVARNGRIGHLSHVERPSSEIRVVVEPLQPVMIGSEGPTAVLQGGMAMTLMLDDTRFAGSYAGTLTVVVHHF